MSLTSIFSSKLALGSEVTRSFLGANITATYLIESRGKKSVGGGASRNRAGMAPGKKYGLKVYDGQRIPFGTVLMKQSRLVTLPGWNVVMKGRHLTATCSGRFMMTTELIDPDLSNTHLASSLPTTYKPNEKIYRQYLHVVPDRQHQIFKLVDEV